MSEQEVRGARRAVGEGQVDGDTRAGQFHLRRVAGPSDVPGSHRAHSRVVCVRTADSSSPVGNEGAGNGRAAVVAVRPCRPARMSAAASARSSGSRLSSRDATGVHGVQHVEEPGRQYGEVTVAGRVAERALLAAITASTFRC